MSLEQERRDLAEVFYSRAQAASEGKDYIPFDDCFLNSLLLQAELGVSLRQVMISYTKWMHGFDTNNVSRDLARLQGEVLEAFEAYNNVIDIPGTVEELADVVIYCYGIATMLGHDLDTVIRNKMEYNIQRSYERQGD